MDLILKAIIYILSILGSIASIYAIHDKIMKYKHVRWGHFTKLMIKAKNQLVANKYLPTLIVGIGRGGAITGAVLSGCFGHIPLIVIDRVYEWTDKLGRKDNILEEIKLRKNLGRVLITAGELHTGNTMRLYKNYFQEIGAKEVCTFAFWKESEPVFTPDYFCIESDRKNLRLPWMITEVYKSDSRHP